MARRWRAAELLGGDPKREGYWDRLAAFFSRTRIEVPDLSATGIKATLKSDPTFQQDLQRRMAGHVGALVLDVRHFFEETIKALKKQHGDGAELVLLVDSVEQIRGTSTNAEDVQQSVENLFAGHADKLRIPYVHVVYTVPPYLKVRYSNLGQLYDGGAVQIFPAITVRHKETGDEYDGGIDALRRVARARGDVARLLGSGELLRRVILASGGHLRDLLSLLAEVTRRAHALPVDSKTVDAAINQIRTEFLPITDDDARWLAMIATTHKASLAGESNLRRFARFLDTHVVLCFRNGTEWYDVHPLIKDIVVEQARALKNSAHAGGPPEQSDRLDEPDGRPKS